MEEQLSKDVLQILEQQLKAEMGGLWTEFQSDLTYYAKLIAKLQWQLLTKRTANLELAMKYAEVGLDCLKAKLQYRAEAASLKLISAALTTALQVTLVAAKAALVL